MKKATAAHILIILAFAAGGQQGMAASAPGEAPRQRMLKALNTILPEVNFKEARLEGVVDFLSQSAGVNIIIDPAVYVSAKGRTAVVSAPPAAEGSASVRPSAAPQERPDETAAEGKPPFAEAGGVTLRLKNVPLKAVLKYVLKYKNLRYIVEDYAIVIVPIGWTPPEELRTEVFRLKTGSYRAVKPMVP